MTSRGARLAAAALALATAARAGAQMAPAPPPASPCPPGTVQSDQPAPEGTIVCVQVTPPAATPPAATAPPQQQPAAEPAPQPVPQPQPPPQPVPQPQAAPQPPPQPVPQPPAVTDEDEEQAALAARALERQLVSQGGLTLRAGHFELVPELTFAFTEGSQLLRTGGQDVAIGTRSEIYTGAFTVRVGLPFRFQAEATAPWVWSRWTGLSDDPAAGTQTGSGIGDLTVGVTWQPIHARPGLPDVLVAGFWKARNGDSALDDPGVTVPLGNGIEQVGGSLSIVKAIDPVVLVVTGRYGHAVGRWAPFGWIDAGDEYGASASANLAVSPETSFSFGLDTGYTQKVRVGESEDTVEPIPGSDATAATFRVGVSTLASRHGMLQVNLGIGLTSAVPRFDVNVAVPFQF